MFQNREDAGNQLGIALEQYQYERPLLLGIPRGGVEVGYHAAVHLDCDFDVLIVRKLGHPEQPEAAFGALAEDGSLYLDPWSNKYLTKEIIQKVIEREKREIKRRIKTYRREQALPDLTDRVVILVDDGIATGSTIFVATEMCRKQKAKQVVVAAPVSGYRELQKLEAKADKVVILETMKKFYAVSQGYLDFANSSDDEVIHFMDLWREKHERSIRPDQ